MRKKHLTKIIAILAILFFSAGLAYSQENQKAGKLYKGKVQEGEGLGDRIKKDKKLKLTINKVLDYLMKNNFDVKETLIDYKGTTSGLNQFDAKYDTTLFAEGGYTYWENPNQDNYVFSGKDFHQGDYSAGVKRQFSTGTSISLSYEGYVKKVNDTLVGFGGPTIFDVGDTWQYQNGFKVSLTQELLKNAFGADDRYSRKKIKNQAEAGKMLLKAKLAGLIVEGLTGYWQIAIAEQNLDTKNIALKSKKTIRNIVVNKARLGLSEREEIFNYNGQVLKAQNDKESAKQGLFEAQLALLRVLNIETDQEIELGQTFKTTPPGITLEQAHSDAMTKRMDLISQRVYIKNAELEYKSAASNLDPSLQAIFSYGTTDYDQDSYAKTYDNINNEIYAGLKLTYPLGNTKADTRMRDARLDYAKKHVELKRLEKEIKDQIAVAVKNCNTTYKIYKQSQKAHTYAKNYYYQVITKFRRGRYSTLAVDQALNAYIGARLLELDSLVKYNIAILNRDLARNMIFENFDIPVDDILKKHDR